ncbi:MAG: hypothetical protein ABDK94_04505 [Atribacterota bacterium]
MAVTGEAVKASPKKKPRIAQEKNRSDFVSSTTTGKSVPPRHGTGEVVMYLLIFGLVSVLFLNFMGIIEVPFLQFLRLEGKTAPSQTALPESLPSQAKDEVALYQGPQLELINTPNASPLTGKLGGNEMESVQIVNDGMEVVVESERALEAFPIQETTSPVQEESGGKTVSTPENVYRIAKIYSAMEPQEAVQILEKLSDEEVMVILAVMKERQVAEILKAFPVERAVEIARKMMKGR